MTSFEWFERSDEGARRALAVALFLPVVLAGGCRRGPEGFDLLPLVQAKSYTVARGGGRLNDGLTFPRAPEIHPLEVDNERRPVVLTPAEPWFWRGRVPAGAVLHAGAQALPAVWQAAHRLEIEITARDGRTREILDVAHSANRRQPQRWVDLDVDLARWAGREITLEIAASLPGLPPQYRDANLVGWSPVMLTTTQEQRTAERPNILFIVVDTLRADHLTPYGYTVHDTSPEIQRRLADHGLVVENAYSQAPWTLPSVVSFLTGRYAGELLGEDLSTYGIPDGVKPLAERLGALGYDTGGFFANPTLHAGAGFERGFSTFFAPPADVEWIRKHADELNRHAEPWLRAHQSRPFFLYVHYVDPHDPYENPDMAGGIGGRAQFMPGYTGVIGADWIHGIYSGKLQLANPAVDIPYISALYDGEIHYADRFIGALLDQLDPAVLKNTLIVLTADHGEELHDHGGWKHGQSLYNEQIHVPLIFRWDGRIPSDKRLAGTVRLLDLVPTLVAAAGGPADPSWEGTNILPALTGKGPLPRLAAFSEGMSGGPLRASAVLEQRKLILFNREEPFQPADELQGYLWQKDLARFERAELYDLHQDTGEHHNLAADHPDWVDGLQPILHGQLGTELEGLWILPDGLPVGARLSGSVTFEHPPGRWAPYFLGPADKAELSGNRLRFELLGDRLTKGIRIKGDFGRILAVEAMLDGKPLPAGSVRTGAATPWSGAPATPAGLRSRGWPLTGPSSPLLRLWIFDNAGAVERRTKADSETEKGLQNLGYIGKKKK
jgi:arylsulfatase A-like enzyme